MVCEPLVSARAFETPRLAILVDDPSVVAIVDCWPLTIRFETPGVHVDE